MVIQVGPGDVLAVLGSTGIFSRGIRWFERIAGKPAIDDHCIIVTHQDEQGRWLGISGQPGGVGLADCTRFLNDPLTRCNHAQPRKTDNGQLTTFLAASAKSLGISYDWVGVAIDALEDMHIPAVGLGHVWRWPTQTGVLPGHVVCSSLCAMLYEEVGWAHPDIGRERMCQPADWVAWIDQCGWMATKRV